MDKGVAGKTIANRTTKEAYDDKNAKTRGWHIHSFEIITSCTNYRVKITLEMVSGHNLEVNASI